MAFSCPHFSLKVTVELRRRARKKMSWSLFEEDVSSYSGYIFFRKTRFSWNSHFQLWLKEDIFQCLFRKFDSSTSALQFANHDLLRQTWNIYQSKTFFPLKSNSGRKYSLFRINSPSKQVLVVLVWAGFSVAPDNNTKIEMLLTAYHFSVPKSLVFSSGQGWQKAS